MGGGSENGNYPLLYVLTENVGGWVVQKKPKYIHNIKMVPKHM